MTDFVQPLLDVTDLGYTYPKATAPAVEGLNLTVSGGEVLGLLGPNGAGKTTAVSVISTLLPPQRGKITVIGMDLSTSQNKARAVIGLAPQEIALYGSLTARENLSYFGSLYGMKGSELADRVERRLSHVGLSERADERVDTYSGGMKRRTNLAAALVHDPRLILLDEPTVGVDAQSRRLIMELIGELRAGGAGIIYTTHYMEEAHSLCDRIAVMDDGRKIVEGTPSELMAAHPGCASLEELFISLTGQGLRD